VSLLDRLAPRKQPGGLAPRFEIDATRRPNGAPVAVGDPVFATKALRKFLATLTSQPSPILLDLGPVVGSNVSFFGEQLGCKIFVEDIFADLDRHARDGKLDGLPRFFQKRFPQAAGTFDGILCWDLFDYLDKAAAQALACELMRLLRPDGALLGFFGTGQTRDTRYTKFVIVDDVNLRHRSYPAVHGRQTALLNRDIIKLFAGLRVSESFLLQNNLREILFRKTG
jgi:hypothetical protein